MIVERKEIAHNERLETLKKWLEHDQHRLGLISSIDGTQLITLLLDLENHKAVCLESPLASNTYESLTPRIPLCHWYERICADLFGLIPEGHPRLKPTLLQRPYDKDFYPLLKHGWPTSLKAEERIHKYLEVKGEGVYEIPVGPIHAGIIEPGHFRFSCLGEVILNLEIQLGYVHRGIEKRITEVPWRKARFVAESAATDSVAAYALAFSCAIESLFETTDDVASGSAASPKTTQNGARLRQMALEIERVAMHISDLSGFAADIGYLGIAASFSRMRGSALGLADLLSGNRFFRGFVRPGGAARNVSAEQLKKIEEQALRLIEEFKPAVHIMLENQAVHDRMSNTGRVSHSIADNFGLVGVAARASGVKYDARMWSPSMVHLPLISERTGDVLARAKVRIGEVLGSLEAIASLSRQKYEDAAFCPLPEQLPLNAIGIGIVEAHRGELIHLIFTDNEGRISRCVIKDPSVNNWTALPIAIRNNLVADFPLCNKSFALAYSGHDL